MPAPVINSSGLMSTNVSSVSSSVQNRSFDYQSILLFLYLCGVVLLISRLLWHILLISRAIRKSTIIENGKARLVRIAGFRSSFSFFNYVFINPSIDENEIKEIVNHELVHINQKHWLDLLLTEALRIFQWMNPFAWIYTGFVRINHEYMADEGALQRTSDPVCYRAALINQLLRSPVISLSNSFNYSLNKKRFDMMKKIITSPYRKIKVLLVLPVIAGIFYAFATPEYNYVSQDDGSDAIFTIYESAPIVQKEVRGIVVTEDGKPLQGVNITVTGSLGIARQVSTDSKGHFVLSYVEPDAVLLFFYRGYKGQSHKVDFTKEMRIIMLKDPDYVETDYSKMETEQGSPLKRLIVLDGEIIDEPAAVVLSRLGVSDIGLVKDLTEEEATDKYGEAGKNGAIEIYTRKKAVELGIKVPYKREGPDDYPTFKRGNILSFTEWVIMNTKYPAEASAKGIQGRVSISIKIEADGSISEIKPMGSPDPILSDAVIKTIISAPKWDPPKNPEVEDPFSSYVNVKFKLPDEIIKDDAFVVVEEMPLYPGGEVDLLQFIADNTHYPDSAKAHGIEGRVIVRFIVNTEGNAEDFVVLKGVHPSIDAEALRVVSLLRGFSPGRQNGVPVNVYYMVPITFTLK